MCRIRPGPAGSGGPGTRTLILTDRVAVRAAAGHDRWSADELTVDAEVVGPGLPEAIGVGRAGQAAGQRQAGPVGQPQPRAVPLDGGGQAHLVAAGLLEAAP